MGGPYSRYERFRRTEKSLALSDMRKLNRPVESGSLIIAIKSKGRNITLINNNK